jgi:hypothetical protein
VRAIYDGTGYIKRHYPRSVVSYIRFYAFSLSAAEVRVEYDSWKSGKDGAYVRGMPVFDVGKYTSVVLDKGGATVKHRCVEFHDDGTVKDVV